MVELVLLSVGQVHAEEGEGGQGRASCSLRSSCTLWSSVLRDETAVDTGTSALVELAVCWGWGGCSSLEEGLVFVNS